MTESDYLKRPDAQPHLKVMECLRRWDPIGVFGIDSAAPADEYDSYSPEIVRMLDAGVDVGHLVEHLRGLAEHHMGVHCDEEKTREIAEQMVAYWRRLR